MFTIVGLVIFSFILMVVLSFSLQRDKQTSEIIGFKFKPRGRTLLGLAPLLLIFMMMIKVVPVNSVGIVFNQLSGVQEEVLSEGYHIKSPFEIVYNISTEVQTKTVENVTGQTKDAQWIAITMDIKYRVSTANAFEVFKRFKSLDKVNSTLLAPLVQRSIESVTTKYNVIDILGEKRNEVYLLIEQEVKTRLAESGIEFFSLVLTDTDAGAAIESAIEAEAVAKKAVETAMQAQAKAEIEANTKVIQATAAAQVTLIEAEAKAKVVLVEAEANAEANRLLSKSITPEILKKMEMEARIKWGWITISGAQLIVDAE